MPGSKSDYLELELLDHVLGAAAYTAPATLHLALFTAAPTDVGGGTEVTGGGYTRKAVTNDLTNFPAASGGLKQLAVAQSFPQATADWGEVVAWGIFDAASGGNLLYWGYLAGAAKNFSAVAATDVFTSTAHGFTDGMRVRVEALSLLSLPGGIVANTTYYVRDAAANTFKLAASSGGAAIDVTSDGVGLIYEWKSQTINSGGTATFNANALEIRED